MGVFCTNDVKAGQVVWSFEAANVVEYDDQEARELCRSLSLEGQVAVATYSYYCASTGRLLDIRHDDGRYFNHSDEPNVGLGMIYKSRSPGELAVQLSDRDCVALVDIPAGSELLDNYRTFGEEPDWFITWSDSLGVNNSFYRD
jgi:hypothetical protein